MNDKSEEEEEGGEEDDDFLKWCYRLLGRIRNQWEKRRKESLKGIRREKKNQSLQQMES